ncbi:MAG: flavodoxin-dependent (E)-4-hydroxy-3-methylbut-2-enyl-diphosphate synthase, partial [Clostridia bacterium]|nr:flavodoxin-dependent (E)-4-hydroxy-3-methylbut-2-enyl-diphosphate synthase [Clostridia bacterium]
MFERRVTQKIKIGNIFIGSGELVAVQSMLNKRSDDFAGSVAQAKELEAAGCDIIRAAVPDMAAVRLINELKNAVDIPVVADIHFDYRLALECVSAGVDKIRIN